MATASLVGTNPNIEFTQGEDEEPHGTGFRRRWRKQKVASLELAGNPGDEPIETKQFSTPSGYRLIGIDSSVSGGGTGRHVEIYESLGAYTTTTTTTTL